MKKDECQYVVPTADLLSAMEALTIYGGKNTKSTNGYNTYCKGAECDSKTKRNRPRPNSTTKCNVYCGGSKGCLE